MKTLLALFLLTGFSLAPAIDGTWKGSLQGPNGNMEITFEFKVEGDKLTGTVKVPMGEMPITNGIVKGKEFSFDVDVNGTVIKHNCTEKDDNTIAMKVIGSPGGDSEVILKREQ